MTDRTRHEIDLIDSANKHIKYKSETIKKFNDWLDTCPIVYVDSTNPYSNDTHLKKITFNLSKRK